MPAALEPLSEKLFALAAAVNIGRIEKVDPGVERGIEHGRGSRGIRPPTEVVASQANKTHVKRSKLAIFHGLYITIRQGQTGRRPAAPAEAGVYSCLSNVSLSPSAHIHEINDSTTA